jgi:hypothetical protein
MWKVSKSRKGRELLAASCVCDGGWLDFADSVYEGL